MRVSAKPLRGRAKTLRNYLKEPPSSLTLTRKNGLGIGSESLDMVREFDASRFGVGAKLAASAQKTKEKAAFAGTEQRKHDIEPMVGKLKHFRIPLFSAYFQLLRRDPLSRLFKQIRCDINPCD
jgi:hypothetical protein